MAGLFSFVFIFSLFALIIGLIRPSVFSRILPASRKIQSLVFGGIFIFSSVVVGITAPATPTQNLEETKQETKGVSTSQISLEPIKTIVPTQLPTATPSPTNTPTPLPTAKPKATNMPIPTKTPVVQTAPTSTPVPVLNIQSNLPSSGGGYSCNCAKTCSQISSCEEAQYLLNTCGCGARDGDNDGIACDGAPLHCQN